MDGWQTIASKSTPEALSIRDHGDHGPSSGQVQPMFSPMDQEDPLWVLKGAELAAFLNVFNPWLPPKSGWIHAKKIWR
jgi:hypothetical protein